MNAKPYHYAAKINSAGGVSALCYSTPRRIDLKRALWTNRPEAVTCPMCRALLAAAVGADSPDGGRDEPR